MIVTLILFLIKKIFSLFYPKYKYKLLKYRRLSRGIAFFTKMHIPAEHVRNRPWLSHYRYTMHFGIEIFWLAQIIVTVGLRLMRFYMRPWVTTWLTLLWILSKTWIITIKVLSEIYYIIQIIMCYRLYFYNLAMCFHYYFTYAFWKLVNVHGAYQYFNVSRVFSFWVALSGINNYRLFLVRVKNLFSFNRFKKIKKLFKKND